MNEQNRLVIICIAVVLSVGLATITIPYYLSSSTPIYRTDMARVEIDTAGDYSFTVNVNNEQRTITGSGENNYTFTPSSNSTTYWQLMIDYPESSSHPVSIVVTDGAGNVLVSRNAESGRLTFLVNMNAA
jgi:hypothetical protein